MMQACAMYRTISHDPQREPWDLPDLEPRDGLARLLAEARQWHKEDADGA